MLNQPLVYAMRERERERESRCKTKREQR